MKPHHPQKLPIKLDYSQFAKLLADAQFALGRLDGLQNNLQNPYLLIAPLTAKEATVSSKIEGTQSSVSDVFLHEAGEKTKYKDAIEVSNYKKATLFAINELKGKPLSLNLIKELHKMLLENTRGAERLGMFRTDQVWIGESGAPIEKATYIPPEWNLIPDYMDNLEKFIHYEEEDILVHAALIHYQFEAIHPFNDGNGRIGRLLIPLFLHYRGRISLPILYLSGYFESNRDAYINTLHKTDESSNFDYWIQYFLEAVIVQSKQTQDLISEILNLYDKVRKETESLKSPYMSRLIEFLFKKPIFTTPLITQEIHAHRATIIRLLNELSRLGIIKELPRHHRRKVFVFTELVRLL